MYLYIDHRTERDTTDAADTVHNEYYYRTVSLRQQNKSISGEIPTNKRIMKTARFDLHCYTLHVLI